MRPRRSHPGENRLAFGLLGADNAFLYGKTAVYIARGPEGRASGPFLAPADSLEAAPRFRSKGADHPSEAKAVYSTDVDLPRPGRWAVLAMTRMPGGALQGAGTQISVARKTPVPSVGEKPPAVETETATALAGALDKI